MAVRNGRVVTPPVTASILESVARETFLKIMPEDLGVLVDVRDIAQVELDASDEVFLCRTGWEIASIASIDELPLGKEYPGLLTRRIAEYARVADHSVKRVVLKHGKIVNGTLYYLLHSIGNFCFLDLFSRDVQ